MPVGSDAEVPENAIWFDLVTPTQQEDRLVEKQVGIAVPTREEMQEIEVTSRLYVENGARYMTATLMCQSDSEKPKTTPVTFILSGQRLITVRYDEPRPFLMGEVDRFTLLRPRRGWGSREPATSSSQSHTGVPESINLHNSMSNPSVALTDT